MQRRDTPVAPGGRRMVWSAAVGADLVTGSRGLCGVDSVTVGEDERRGDPPGCSVKGTSYTHQVGGRRFHS